MNKFNLIRGALNKLSVPFDETNYVADRTYKVAEFEYDSIIFSAFANTNINVNTAVVNLNLSLDDKIDYNGSTYNCFMLPDDMLYLIERPSADFFIGRNRIYSTESSLTIKYSKTNDISKLSPRVYKYLEYYLASELAPSLNRGEVQAQLFQRAMYELEELKKAEYHRPIPVIDSMGFDLY